MREQLLQWFIWTLTSREEEVMNRKGGEEASLHVLTPLLGSVLGGSKTDQLQAPAPGYKHLAWTTSQVS